MRTEQQIRPGGQTAQELYLKSVLSIRPVDQQKLGQLGVNLLRNIRSVTVEEIENNFMLPQPLSSQIEMKPACAKLLNSGDVVVDCYQCRYTPISVVCLNCFKDSDHEGHNYYVTKLQGRFCCKCGDKQAWKENGFCHQHTGQHSQFVIPEQFMKEGRQKLHTLFYIYFYLAATNRRLWMKYSDCLMEFLIKVNTDSLWHNKMTALILKDKLKMDLNPLLNQGTVLENILKHAVSQHMIYEWVPLFLLLFSYIPFKFQLLAVFFQKYGELVDGSSASVTCANLLSIHLMNCEQLILAYSKSFKFGLGQKNKLRPTYSAADDKKELFKSYYIQMFSEINMIGRSSHDVLLAYWQMYIQYEQGLSPLFQYYEDMLLYSVKNLQQKKDRFTILFQVLQMASIERNAIIQFCVILRVFRKQKEILKKLIQYFWQKCMDQQDCNPDNIIYIFRPYERCLGLTIFTYFELQFNYLNQQQIIEQVFKNDKDGFHKLMNIVLPKILKTYFFSAMLHSQPGIIQSLRCYMQNYKTDQPFLFQTDIMCIKIFIILLGRDFSQSILEEVKRNIPVRSQKKLYFNNVMDYIRYLYTFETSQATIVSIIDPLLNSYKMSVADLLERLFYEYKGCVSMQVIRIVKDRLFSKQYQYVHQWVETNCDSNRQRKEVTLKANVSVINKGLDFNDFWQTNLHNSSHRDPWKTVDTIIKYGRRSTSNVSYYLWNEKSLAELHAWYKTLYRPDSQQGVQEIFMNVLHIYLLKKEVNQEIVDIKRDIINPNVHLLSPQFRRRYYNQPQPLQVTAVYFRNGIMQEYPLGQQPYPFSSESSPLNQKQSDPISENLEPYSYQSEFSQPDQEEQEEQPYMPPPPVQRNEQASVVPRPQKNLSIKQIKQQKKKIILENRRRRLQGLSELERQPPISQKANAVRVEQQQQKYQCCVCKQENKNDLVYLIKLDSRNSEFILNLGEGVGCLSYISCFHIFCIGCIKTIIQQKYVMECQVCHSKPTFILPLTHIEESVNQVIMKKIREAASKRMNFISVQHTIIVSFYHFVLLCYVDINNAKSNRAHLYKIMLNQLLFYVGEQNSRAIARARLWRVFSYLKTERIYHQIQNAKQTKQSQYLVKQEEQDSEQESQQVECSWDRQMSLISEGDNYKRKFDIAMSVLKIFFKARIRNQKTSQQKLQKAISRFQDKSFVKLCIICFKIVFDEQLSQEDREFIKNYEHPKQIHPIVKIFPSKRQRYFPRLVCTCCGEMSADMTECLLCSQWVGCQKCENGTNQKHIIDAHKGGLGLFMDVQDTKPFYQSWHGVSVEKPVYENFWGDGPTRLNRTQSFEFNPKLIKKIEETLVYDKNIPYFGPKP